LNNKTFIPIKNEKNNAKFRKLSKSSGKRFCDELWSVCVKMKFNEKCAICGSDLMINAHHLISRRVSAYRWDISNGFAICPAHHKFDLHVSAHTAPWGFEQWIRENCTEDWEKWVSNRENFPKDFEINYDEIYHKLENHFFLQTGQYYKIDRISHYLLSFHVEELKEMHEQKLSQTAMAEKFDVGPSVITDMLKRNKIIKVKRKTQTK